MKMLISLLVTFATSSAFAICGKLSFQGGQFYMDIDGSGQVQLYARDTLVSKSLTRLNQRIGSHVCVAGEFQSNYLFYVLRID